MSPSRSRALRPAAEPLETRRVLSAGTPAASVAPMSVSLAMTDASDPDADGLVTQGRVMLVGQTVPGAVVRLVGGSGGRGAAVTAGALGRFRIQAAVAPGENSMRVVATDRLGRTASAGMTVTRTDVVIAWNEAALDVMRAVGENVGMASRNLAILQGAVYDAVDDIDHAHEVYRVDFHAPPGASREASASEAAYQVLVGLYPAEKSRLDATLAQTLGSVRPGPSKAEGVALGRRVAASYLAWRSDDGSSAEPVYKVGDAPGQWRPTPPDYRNAWGPAWGQVTPFAVPDPSAFLPPPPPALDSPEYAADLNQVESLGALDSTTRTADQTQAALFWAYDTAGTGPPPIRYNEVLQQVAMQQGNSLDQDARLFAMADVAMADAAIVAWQAKYDYDLWRPITAIRLADTDGNPATTADPTWTPLGSPGHGVYPDYTPPFPSYVSGHATFGGALFTVLTDFYGTDNVQFTLTSDELPGVTRSYDSFSAASQENAMSRVYLGVHFLFDATAGVTAGDAIGGYVAGHLMQ